MEEFDCKKCLHEKVCALWASRESQNASCFCTDGCDYFTPTLTPPNEPLTCEGCACKEYSRDSYPCNSCFRNDETLSDQYRPPEGEA